MKGLVPYRKAIEYFDDEALTLDVPIDRFSLPEEHQILLGERLKALNNLALCQIKIDALDSALMSLSYVLKVEVNKTFFKDWKIQQILNFLKPSSFQPNNEKALYRKGKALQSKNRIDEALGIYKRIQTLYPNNTQVKADILKCVFTIAWQRFDFFLKSAYFSDYPPSRRKTKRKKPGCRKKCSV